MPTTEIVAAESLSDSDVSYDDVELDEVESVDEDAVPRQKIEVDDKVYFTFLSANYQDISSDISFFF